jgi:transcriptional regulator with PAS, ATPase and Fis domain
MFLNRFSHIHHRKHKIFSPEAMKVMVNYPWPGNVRELQNTIERIVVTQRERVISPRHLLVHFKEINGGSDKFIVDLGLSLKEVEKKLIQETLTKVTSKHKEAAKVLGLSLRALQYKLKEYDLL